MLKFLNVATRLIIKFGLVGTILWHVMNVFVVERGICVVVELGKRDIQGKVTLKLYSVRKISLIELEKLTL
jgi:hypothetical protein